MATLRIKLRSGRWPRREKTMKILVTGATGTVGSGVAYDLRLMFQGFVERGFSNTQDQTAHFGCLARAPAENVQRLR